jgi:hypothetical protein
VDADRLRITTDEQRTWLSIARERGGLCAGCGRALGRDEPIYIERVAVERKPLTGAGARWSQQAVYRDAPLGVECTSATFLAETQKHPPEVCGGCGRPVYYEVGRWGRQSASCSRRWVARRTRLKERPT